MRREIGAVLAMKLPFRAPEGAELLTTSEVARFLRVSRWTLYAWRKNGAGPPSLLLSRQTVRYPRVAFMSYMRQHLGGAIRARAEGSLLPEGKR